MMRTPVILCAALLLLVACDDDFPEFPSGADASVEGSRDEASGTPRACTDDTEPNDTPSAACQVELGTRVQARIENGGTDAADCFRFDVATDVDYTLGVIVTESTATGYNEGLAFDVKSPDGSLVVTRQKLSANQTGEYIFQSAQPGAAVLCFTPQNPQALYVYKFRIDPDYQHGLVQDAVTHEPNNSLPTGYPVPLGTPMNSRMEAGLDDDTDCFRFDVVAQVPYTLGVIVNETTAKDFGSTALRFNVNSESGSLLLQDRLLSANQTDEYIVTPIQSGMMALCLTPQDPLALFVYKIRLDPDWKHGLVQDPTSYEPNNSLETSYPVELGTLVSSRIEEGVDDDVDCFRFEATAVPYTLTVSVTQSTATGYGSLGLGINVKSEAGSILLTDQFLAAGKTNSWPFTPLQAGMSVVCFKPQQPLALFAYNFRVDPAPAAAP